jgi:thiosulfate/3-mercaptopyruvate sulfurtransferase
MPLPPPSESPAMSALISPQDLYALFASPTLKLVDASYPAVPDFHAQARIGNAVLFDIESICDHSNPLPHMLPSEEDFAAAVGALGIGNDDDVVIYDQSGMAMAAARAWWMFRCFGHQSVRVLNGGMPLWHKMGLPIEHTPPQMPEPSFYKAVFHPALLASRQMVLDATTSEDIAIIDARGAERFTGAAADKRPGLQSGHIPGSYNIPFSSLIDPGTGQLRINDARIAAMAQNKDRKLITSCGSGVTACVLALALYESGHQNTAVYDGSWSEWATPALNLPIATGPGKNFA